MLRQLVELQLSGPSEAKDIIDRAWGVVHNKHRKREGLTAPPDPSDPHSQQKLSSNPIGTDKDRQRYWVFDGSYAVYLAALYLWLFVPALTFSAFFHLILTAFSVHMMTSDSARLYVSTNPWKTSSTFKAVANNKDEYLRVIEKLKSHPVPTSKKEKWGKNEAGHFALIAALEERIPAIDNEIAVSLYLP